MTARFAQVGLPFEFVESIAHDDPLIAVDPEIQEVARAMGRWSEMAWSCIHGHLKIIERFLASDCELAVICEDDVMLSQSLAQDLPQAVRAFQGLDLDVMLLGYLTPDQLDQVTSDTILQTDEFIYHGYEFNVYGTQMYLISREYAEFVHRTYGIASGFGRRTLVEPGLLSFNADWIITKNGRRARVYPLLAIEERGGGKGYNDPFQEYWHDHCHDGQVGRRPYF